MISFSLLRQVVTIRIGLRFAAIIHRIYDAIPQIIEVIPAVVNQDSNITNTSKLLIKKFVNIKIYLFVNSFNNTWALER